MPEREEWKEQGEPYHHPPKPAEAGPPASAHASRTRRQPHRLSGRSECASTQIADTAPTRRRERQRGLRTVAGHGWEDPASTFDNSVRTSRLPSCISPAIGGSDASKTPIHLYAALNRPLRHKLRFSIDSAVFTVPWDAQMHNARESGWTFRGLCAPERPCHKPNLRNPRLRP